MKANIEMMRCICGASSRRTYFGSCSNWAQLSIRATTRSGRGSHRISNVLYIYKGERFSRGNITRSYRELKAVDHAAYTQRLPANHSSWYQVGRAAYLRPTDDVVWMLCGALCVLFCCACRCCSIPFCGLTRLTRFLLQLQNTRAQINIYFYISFLYN